MSDRMLQKMDEKTNKFWDKHFEGRDYVDWETYVNIPHPHEIAEGEVPQRSGSWGQSYQSNSVSSNGNGPNPKTLDLELALGLWSLRLRQTEIHDPLSSRQTRALTSTPNKLISPPAPHFRTLKRKILFLSNFTN